MNEPSADDRRKVVEVLALAMGWTWSVERTPWGEPMWFVNEEKTITRGFNPFVNGDCCLILLEWVRRQPWFLWICVESTNGSANAVQMDYLTPTREKEIVQGTLKEALPWCVFHAFNEVQRARGSKP